MEPRGTRWNNTPLTHSSRTPRTIPGGHASGVVFPRSAAEVAGILDRRRRGPADRRAVVADGRRDADGRADRGDVEADARASSCRRNASPSKRALTVAAMQEHLAAAGGWFPPAPTFTGALGRGHRRDQRGRGGHVQVRQHARLGRGARRGARGRHGPRRAARSARRRRGSSSRSRRGAARVTVPVPSYVMPAVAKRSAGYHAAPAMDLVDLFIGAEGTLGLVTQVTFRIVSPAPQSSLALVPCRSEPQALAVVGQLRDASRETWRTSDPTGIDAAAIENMDRRSIAILREDGVDARNQVSLPGRHRGRAARAARARRRTSRLPRRTIKSSARCRPGARTRALDAVLPPAERLGAARRHRARAAGRSPPDRAARRDSGRRAGRRESARRRGQARRRSAHREDRGRHGRAGRALRGDDGDLPARASRRAALDYAIWGHISDGNVHPNVIPRSLRRRRARERGDPGIRTGGRQARRMSARRARGWAAIPSSRRCCASCTGTTGIEQMRAVKRALDPHWKLAPGVIFER